MAEIGVIHTTLGSTETTNSSSFVEVIESADLVDGTTYHIVCHAITRGPDNANVFDWRLYDRTNNEVITESLVKREMTQANKPQSYYYVGRITAGDRGGGIAFEQKSDGVQTLYTDFVSMMIFDLSVMNESDYFYAEDTTAAQHTTSLVDRASVTNANPLADDEYLVWTWGSFLVDSVNGSAEMVLNCTEPASTGDEPLMLFEGEDLTEQLGWMFCRHYTYGGSNSSITWKVQTRDDTIASGRATQTDYAASTIFGLRLNAFENFFGNYTSSLLLTTTTGWKQLDTSGFKTDNDSDVVVSAAAMFDGTTTLKRSGARIQLDGTTSPNNVPNTKLSCNTNDATDRLPLSYITKYSATADSSTTIDLDCKKPSGANIGWDQYTLAGFTTRLAIVPTTGNKNIIPMLRYGRTKRIRGINHLDKIWQQL